MPDGLRLVQSAATGTECVLVIDDDRGVLHTLEKVFAETTTRVCTAHTAAEGVRQLTDCPPDVVILDIMLPRKNGFDVCRDIRMAGVVVPILMLTARGQVIDRVLGLKIGADDYLIKPFDATELVARVEALIRRSKAPAAPGLQKFGSLHVDLRGTTVFRDGKTVPLSAREFQLLRYFV